MWNDWVSLRSNNRLSTCCEISCFLKTTAKKLRGTNTLLVPTTWKLGGPVSPGPHCCCAYAFTDCVRLPYLIMPTTPADALICALHTPTYTSGCMYRVLKVRLAAANSSRVSLCQPVGYERGQETFWPLRPASGSECDGVALLRGGCDPVVVDLVRSYPHLVWSLCKIWLLFYAIPSGPKWGGGADARPA